MELKHHIHSNTSSNRVWTHCCRVIDLLDFIAFVTLTHFLLQKSWSEFLMNFVVICFCCFRQYKKTVILHSQDIIRILQKFLSEKTADRIFLQTFWSEFWLEKQPTMSYVVLSLSLEFFKNSCWKNQLTTDFSSHFDQNSGRNFWWILWSAASA